MAADLTTKSVEAAKASNARREIPDGRVRGLYLVVQPTGAKSWALRYRYGTKPRKLTLGTLAPTLPEDGNPPPEMGKPLTLAGARTVARDQLDRVDAGHDPAGDLQAAKMAAKNPPEVDVDLVKAVAARFLKDYLKPRAKPRYYGSVEYMLDKDVLPRWGERRIQDIERRDVRELLAAVVGRGARVHANRVLAVVRKLFNWAVSEDILTTSPVQGVKKPTDEISRERVLTDSELRLFWLACGQLGYPFGLLGKLLLLTATRRDEGASLRRSELVEDGTKWVLPRHRLKRKQKSHIVPLSAQAKAVVAAAPEVTVADDDKHTPRHGKLRDFVFTTTGTTAVSGFGKAKERIDAAMLAIARKEATERGDDPADLKIADWTFHDLRRTAASGMARLGVDLPVIERCLNHVSGSFAGVVGVYQRHTYADEMRAAFDLWGAHVEAVAAGRALNVENLAARRRGRRR